MIGLEPDHPKLRRAAKRQPFYFAVTNAARNISDNRLSSLLRATFFMHAIFTGVVNPRIALAT